MEEIRCSLCNRLLNEKEKEPKVPDAGHEDEVKSVGAVYCKDCMTYLGPKTRLGDRKRRIRKNKIRISNYPLPGFVLSRDGNRYVRSNEENAKNEGSK